MAVRRENEKRESKGYERNLEVDDAVSRERREIEKERERALGKMVKQEKR